MQAQRLRNGTDPGGGSLFAALVSNRQEWQQQAVAAAEQARLLNQSSTKQAAKIPGRSWSSAQYRLGSLFVCAGRKLQGNQDSPVSSTAH